MSPPAKRRRTHGDGGDSDAVIEGLPDHIAEICLSLVGRPSFIAAVCSRWRRLLYSPDFPAFLSLYVVFVDPVQDPGRVRVMSFDPISTRWDPLPPPPPESCSLLRRHPSFISFDLPIQSVSVAGKLVLLAGSNRELSPALSCPAVFDPVSSTWSSGPPLESPRRWCAAGAHGGAVYVASGIGSLFSPDVARSAVRWLVSGERAARPGEWEKLRDMRDGRFSREAIDAVGYRGKLLMVNVRGDAVKEGAIYDVGDDTWQAMPAAMVAGWRGPVAAMSPEEETLYAVDEKKGSVRKYDEERGVWGEVMVEEERLRGAQQVTAVAGKLCVVAGGGCGARRVVVVDVMAAPAKVWTVTCPEGLEPVAVHVLPRMTRPEFC